MILLQSPSRFLLQILQDRVQSPEKGVDLHCHSVEFDDARYHIQVSMKKPQVMCYRCRCSLHHWKPFFIVGFQLAPLRLLRRRTGQSCKFLVPRKMDIISP